MLRYREHVDEAMHALIARQAGDAAFDALLALGLNHEQQHQELILTDIKHLLYANPLRPAYAANDAPPPATPAGWTEYAGGVTRIGHDGGGFAFDNEGPAHDTLLGRFHLANRLVTQHEYLAFIRDGGYSRPELWLSQGWDRVCAGGWRAPLCGKGARRLASLHIARHAGTGAAGACHARELLRGRRLRPLGAGPVAARVRMGIRRAPPA